MKYRLTNITITILSTLICCYSCKTRFPADNFSSGKFNFTYIKGKNSIEELILKEDSTFILTSYGSYNPPTCSGYWCILNDTLLIKCSKDENPLAPALSGYMRPRERKLKIMNNDKLKMRIENNVKRKYVILERVKE